MPTYYQIVQVLCMLLLPILVLAVTGPVPDFDALIPSLQGDDKRLFRWDAFEHTKAQQADEKVCGKEVIDKALSFIVAQNSKSKDAINVELLTKSLEYTTLCITDNPTNRATFASFSKIHDSIVGLIEKLLARTDVKIEAVPKALSKLAHVIYITSFANTVNHQAYINKGAVTALGNVITAFVKRSEEGGDLDISFPIVTMWSAAALSNLAASYCNSEDSLCYWNWNTTGLVLTEDYGTITSDGAVARENMLKSDEFVQLLVDLSCIGYATSEEEDIMVGENAIIDRDEDLNSIIPWAAAGALKNLALNADARSRYLEPSISCFCHLSQSVDWLESEKALHLLERVRRGYPCLFSRVFNEDEEDLGSALCIDNEYYHDEGWTCADFDQETPPTEEECETVDRNGVAAWDACCACNGGVTVEDPSAHEESEDEL